MTRTIKGHCYCGAVSLRATDAPQAVVYCHCEDCRRATGAPVAAFAAFGSDSVTFTPAPGKSVSRQPGAERFFCGDCGSPTASRFDYLPGQIYVPLGLLDDAHDLVPQVHAYESQRLPWLHIEDRVERFETTSRDRLRSDGNAEGGAS